MARIHLLAWDNRRGLSHDIAVVEGALRELGHEVTITRLGSRRHDGAWRLRGMRLRMRLASWLSLGRQPARFDVNLSLEHVRPAAFGLADVDLLMPNPEWVSSRSLRYLPRYDALLTKTHEATRIFEARGLRAIEVGFRSPDRYDPTVPRLPRSFLHAAGSSHLKGTSTLVEVWKRHPEWPLLTVLRAGAATEDDGGAANLRIVRERLSDEEVRRLQNASTFHLCLSQTEGWGHYLVEAMSCGAVVIACDGAPMNQMIDATRGIPVAAREGEPYHLARTWHVDDTALERAVERAIAMDDAERTSLGHNARSWYLANQIAFPARLGAALDALDVPR
ncbi:glycosyltransferase [Luteibacter aegosomatis]|uniref:glycosyltransferase n=1 Tax=Luteibacter aegosomatis TaxID=2911537 RepID=UPI001FF9572C|nr:glycosyltransferase [Luteibacter aegosomatis]UPG86011.1 glycosyltransferase [Luteibacter aegosomatis]